MTDKAQGFRPETIAQAIEGMALSFNPDEAKELNATIQFHVSGKDCGDWNLTIANGQCQFASGIVADPTLTINTPSDIWLKIARKEMSGANAYISGKYKTRGQMGLLLKMDKLFSRQPTAEEITAKGWM